jgi:hypothetical protein
VAEFPTVLGLEFVGPPEGCVPLNVVGVVEYLDVNGLRRFTTLTTDNVTAVDALGMLKWRLILLEQEIIEDAEAESWLEEVDDDDG